VWTVDDSHGLDVSVPLDNLVTIRACLSSMGEDSVVKVVSEQLSNFSIAAVYNGPANSGEVQRSKTFY